MPQTREHLLLAKQVRLGSFDSLSLIWALFQISCSSYRMLQMNMFSLFHI